MSGDYLPPPPRGTTDSWHVLIIRDVPEGDDIDEHGQERIEWLHPGCKQTCGNPLGPDYECHTSSDLANAGYWGLFDRRGENLKPGVWLVHPWVEAIPGGPWGPTEYDGGWTVIRLAEAPYESATDTPTSSPSPPVGNAG